MLRNTPVIHDACQIGLLQGVCFDETRKRVCAFIISSGMHGKKIIQVRHIQIITQEFILVDGWSRYRRSHKQQTSLFVRDTNGLLVGRVTDYAIDTKTLDVLAIEIIPGYLPEENRMRNWIYAYDFSANTRELSIPVILHSRPFFLREGNEACGCPP